jgi:S1-C subfamily serine protease
MQPAPRERVQRGLGSGVIITKDGYLLINRRGDSAYLTLHQNN